MSMKMTKLVLAIGAMAMAGGAMAAANNATANATVTVVSPIEVAKTTDLAFGKVAIPSSGATATTVVITNAGARDAASTSDAVGSQTVAAAVFAITGQDALAYTPMITVSSNSVLGLSLSGFSGQCDAVVAEALVVGTQKGLTGCALTTGASTLKVGGTLTIADTAVAAVAAVPGAISVTVAYD
jgi:hypothetical protein